MTANREKLEDMGQREALIYISMELSAIHEKINDLDNCMKKHYPCQDVKDLKKKMGPVLDTTAITRWLLWFIIPGLIIALIKAFLG